MSQGLLPVPPLGSLGPPRGWGCVCGQTLQPGQRVWLIDLDIDSLPSVWLQEAVRSWEVGLRASWRQYLPFPSGTHAHPLQADLKGGQAVFLAT